MLAKRGGRVRAPQAAPGPSPDASVTPRLHLTPKHLSLGPAPIPLRCLSVQCSFTSIDNLHDKGVSPPSPLPSRSSGFNSSDYFVYGFPGSCPEYRSQAPGRLTTSLSSSSPGVQRRPVPSPSAVFSAQEYSADPGARSADPPVPGPVPQRLRELDQSTSH